MGYLQSLSLKISVKHPIFSISWLHSGCLLKFLVEQLQKLFLPLDADLQLLRGHLIQTLLVNINYVVGGNCILLLIIKSLAYVILIQLGLDFIVSEVSPGLLVLVLLLSFLLRVELVSSRCYG